ncbi:MAG: branched-chain amino acid ABC transporter permease [Alphaproteobacteria bacterium]|nr:branched-chain amino acid ABC transporter permease [Alphaproteobacteria bacterium]MBU1561650.1 branched-chain amino acid ABC transporter permease [Alphaproteobacteria bacterium]MBU2302369.1 branched-chain amino acid ABC transporter permease [Alphaproteobacteria bacterium]MBU2368649.1 branched-chain amino acid ABC transporter permease [Alphaproteobacteria bacterium]
MLQASASGTSARKAGRTRGHQGGRFVVYALVGLIGLALALAPFLFPDVRSQEVAARICVFIVLVASYDLLIGYTGIVSFAHTMFFGMGAYGTAIALKSMGPGFEAILIGGGAGIIAALVLALLIGLLSLRVKAIFFAMVTLAAASVMMVLASQLSDFTGGEDGITYSIPRLFSPAFELLTDAEGKALRLFGVPLNGKIALYYFVFITALVLFLALLRIVASPLGSVLQAIRENEMRAEAIGYRVVFYRTAIFCIAAGVAACAGILRAVWLKYTGPEVVLSFDIMIDILLMVVIGGMGTMLGAVIGVVLMTLAQYYLKDLMAVGAEATASLPIVPDLLNPERWLLWLGLCFILLVYFFPAGIAGTMMGKGGHK